MTTDATGDLNEALVSLAGSVGPVNIGVSPGIRFGSGESTTLSNRVSGPDSTFIESWDAADFALRAGVSVNMGYTTLFSTYTSGDSRYYSFTGLGAVASFPFLNGGFLGTELAVLDGDNTKVTVFSRFPGIVPDTNLYISACGYRPDVALKTGLGIGVGSDYSFGNYRVSAAYQYQGRYREGGAVPVDYINHIYDGGQTVMVGFETAF